MPLFQPQGAGDRVRRPAHGLCPLDQAQRESVTQLLNGKFLAGLEDRPIHHIREIEEPDGPAFRVVLGDQEIFRIHQLGDAAVQPFHQALHVQPGRCHVGNREQRPLQTFGMLETLHRGLQTLNGPRLGDFRRARQIRPTLMSHTIPSGAARCADFRLFLQYTGRCRPEKARKLGENNEDPLSPPRSNPVTTDTK